MDQETQKNLLERLAFIKYLYNVGVEQSRMPEPMCWISILTFHDSIELFLQLACIQKDINSKNISFIEYWEKLAEKKITITQKEPCRQLNEARVSLKHHGTHPAKLDIEGYRATATNFFNENIQTLFGIPFSNISLLSLVYNTEVQNQLREAQSLIEQGNYNDSLEKVIRAFNILLENALNFEKSTYYKDPFKFTDYNYDEVRELQEIKEYFAPMERSLKIICLGLDYKRYAKFYSLTPEEYGHQSREGIFYYRYSGPANKESTGLGNYEIRTASQEEATFCFNFVIECAIKIQDFDYRIDVD